MCPELCCNYFIIINITKKPRERYKLKRQGQETRHATTTQDDRRKKLTRTNKQSGKRHNWLCDLLYCSQEAGKTSSYQPIQSGSISELAMSNVTLFPFGDGTVF